MSDEPSSSPSTPPGWYPDGQGGQRWWDGTQWGEAAPAATPMAPSMAPPAPPWGTWTWADGSPIDVASLPPYEQNKKLVAGLLGIFLGGFGVHKFVLGYTNEGIIQIVATVLTCGIASLLALVEGIIYLTKSDQEFYWTYVAGRKGWF